MPYNLGSPVDLFRLRTPLIEPKPRVLNVELDTFKRPTKLRLDVVIGSATPVEPLLSNRQRKLQHGSKIGWEREVEPILNGVEFGIRKAGIESIHLIVPGLQCCGKALQVGWFHVRVEIGRASCRER